MRAPGGPRRARRGARRSRRARDGRRPRARGRLPRRRRERRAGPPGAARTGACAVHEGRPGHRRSQRATDGSHPAVHIGTGAPRGGDRSREHDLPVAVHEAPFDHGFGRARAHDGGVGTTAEEQFQRLDDERLAGAGLARERRQPGPITRSRSAMTPRSRTRSSTSTSLSAIGQAETVPQSRVEIATRRSSSAVPARRGPAQHASPVPGGRPWRRRSQPRRHGRRER